MTGNPYRDMTAKRAKYVFERGSVMVMSSQLAIGMVGFVIAEAEAVADGTNSCFLSTNSLWP